MALQSSGTISMNDMRSEFGFGSSSISMSQLYRGGSYIDAGGTSTSTITTAHTVPIGAGYGGAGRYNRGDAANPNTGAGGGIYNHGYFRGGVTPSGSYTWPDTYHNKYMLFFNCSFQGGTPNPSFDAEFTVNITGSYYWRLYGYDYYNGYLKIGTYSPYTNILNETAFGGYSCGSGPHTRTGGPITLSTGTTYRAVFYAANCTNAIYGSFGLSPSSSYASATIDLNTGVPGSGQISFNQLYGAT